MARNVPLTDSEKELIRECYAELRAQGMNASDAEQCTALKLGLGARTVRKYRVIPESSTYTDPADGQFVKGKSVLYDADGKVKLQWVKTDNKFDPEQFKEWAHTLVESLPKELPIPTKHDYEDLLTVIPFGDPHIGLYSWRDETGDDFDLDIATKDLCGAVDHLVQSTPESKECLIVNCGDYFHADNNSGETARGHNKLDTDTRWAKVLVAGLKAMKQCIVSALGQHEKVTVINAIGNHDDHSSMFLTVALTHIYENEPRVHIVSAPTIVHYYQFGNNLIGVHHGHTIKPDKLPLIMATDMPKEWGESMYRLWICGHIHQDVQREYQGVRVESFRTLAARDAWAASMGYRSGRDMKAIILHRQFGEVARHLVSVEMLRKSV